MLESSFILWDPYREDNKYLSVRNMPYDILFNLNQVNYKLMDPLSFIVLVTVLLKVVHFLL